MSDNRDPQSAGAPVEESESSKTEVLAAVERSRESDAFASPRPEGLGEAADADPGAEPLSGGQVPAEESADTGGTPGAASFGSERDLEQRPITLDDLPSASQETVRTAYAPAPTAVPGPEVGPDPLAEPAATPAEDRVRDGEIRISSDHPMAALYMQTPMPPDLKGNRGAGVLISILATVAFALVYAGVLALRLAPVTPPSQFLMDGLVPFVTSWGYIAAVVAFFLGMVILVLVVGRAGWWAYVLGGFPVGLLVWAAAVFGYAFDPSAMGIAAPGTWNPVELAGILGLTTPMLGAAIVAREVTIWFGAWIGSRGRRVTAKNARLVADYEEALAEVRSKQ